MSKLFDVFLFDWGNTLMYDFPNQSGPMKDWPNVKAVENAENVLKHLSIKANCYLATNAQDSEESDIIQALKRVKLDNYLTGIFCFKNLNISKDSPEYYQKILNLLNVDPSSVAMIGDSFEKDILNANQCGIFGYWFNPNNYNDNRRSDLYKTIHSMSDLIS